MYISCFWNSDGHVPIKQDVIIWIHSEVWKSYVPTFYLIIPLKSIKSRMKLYCRSCVFTGFEYIFWGSRDDINVLFIKKLVFIIKT